MMKYKSQLKVVGMDPSLRNWGLAYGLLDLTNGSLEITNIQVTNPVLPTGKQTRQNSSDLEAAYQLCEAAVLFAASSDVVFVEVPIGSQSARAMASYGICVGVLGAIRSSGTPFFEVTPNEVKMTTVGRKTATKGEMISWARIQHPEANWPMHHGELSMAKAEHIADAIGAIYGGVKTNTFKQFLQMLNPSQ